MSKLKEQELMCAEVLREKGQSVRAVAAQLGVDESTIRYHLSRRASGQEDGRRFQEEACEPWAPVISAWISRQPWDDPRTRPEPIKALYEQLVATHGYRGSYKAVVRYVRRRAPRPKLRPIRRVETAPGAQAQVDWAQRRVYVHDLGGCVRLQAFVLTLSHSRGWSLVWQADQTMLSWLDAHNRALSEIGGVPFSIRIDNLKTGVASGGGPWAKLNAVYQSYAEQIGFVIDPCRVRKATDKGKVERRNQDLIGGIVGREEHFLTLSDLNAASFERIRKRSRDRRCPITGKSVWESWQVEKQALKPLPETLPTPFDVEVVRTVSDDCLVWFEGRQYAVPFPHMRRSVKVRGCPGRVEIYADGQLLKSYPRGTAARILIDQSCYEGEGTDRVQRPAPLGALGREIVLERSWEAPSRRISTYEQVLGGLR